MSDDFSPTPELERNLRDALATPAPAPAFSNRLRATLIARAAEMKPAAAPRRRAWRWAYILLLGLLLAIIFSPQIVTAMRRLLGYVPGVGLVEQNATIRILPEPVTAKQGHLTITIQQVVADSARTFMAFKVDGIPPTRNGFPICGATPLVRLSDGRQLEFESSGGTGMESDGYQPMSYETSGAYAPIPADVENVTFIMPCILPTPGTGPENWEIPLHLVPAPADFATPGVEIAATYQSSGPRFETTPTATPEPPSEPLPEETLDLPMPPTPTTVPNGSGLYLEKVIEMDTSYLLIGNFTDAGDMPGALEISNWSYSTYRPEIVDADGKYVSFNQRLDIQPEVNWGGVYYWAYEIQKPVKAPLTIRLDSVNIQKSDSVEVQLDTGPQPQAGQTWSLHIPFQAGGYDFVCYSAKMLKNGYSFSWQSTTDLPNGVSFTLELPGYPPSITEGTTGSEYHVTNRVKYSQNFLTDGALPTGLVTVKLTLYQTVELPGPWTITWSPPK